MARLAIFIDGAYIDALAMKEFAGIKIDYAKLADEITRIVAHATPEPLDLFRTYYYNCLPYQSNPPTSEERVRFANARAFHQALCRLKRFEVREGRLALRGRDARGEPIFEQKRIDLLLGIDLALLCGKHQIHHAALIAGDSDLLPAVEAAKLEGVTVWLLHGPRYSPIDGKSTYHFDLWEHADERIELTQEFLLSVER
jgi:uncharacterized LabA/DUF88 family protein